MSKILITQMPYKNTTLHVAALSEKNRIVDLYVQKQGEEPLLGNIYVGKVERVAKDLKAAFVRISKEKVCFLPLKECRHPVYKMPGREGEPKGGDELLVQVSREALKEKLPSVSANLNFTGKYLVLTTGETGLGVSSKLGFNEKQRLKALLSPLKEEAIGIIVRTNAANASDEQIVAEYQELRKTCEKVLEYGISRTCFSCVKKALPQWETLIQSLPVEKLEEIVTDQPGEYQELEHYLSRYPEVSHGILRFYEDSMFPMYKCYRLEKVLEDALKEKVWLKSGAFLVIQHTEAFIAIDVNSGKAEMHRNPEDMHLGINLEAVREIAYQLRLRQLSGIILIDFINMKSREHRQKVIQMLAEYLKQDPSLAVVADMTKLQIVEVTRRKTRKCLQEIL
ncbi:ribonuclease E/G [Novisyntrophococcus fermenticellae]|uniref:ribonuclease E/G n=1 Tax=Novisyntrophococcus fermenticellae TaxID=2068655 RepID=UPI001E316E5B|nr:ribonuclease E/G [Novisyntrophococcus fermenticellae]